MLGLKDQYVQYNIVKSVGPHAYNSLYSNPIHEINNCYR